MQAVTGLGSRVGAGVLLQLILYTAMPQLAFLPDHRCVDEVSCSTLAPCFRVEGTSSLESSAWEFKARETGQSKLTTGLCRVGILRPSISILVCVIYWGGAGCTHASERKRRPEDNLEGLVLSSYHEDQTQVTVFCSKCPDPLSHPTRPTLCVFLNRLLVENKSQTLEGNFYRQVVSNYRQYRFAFY